MLSYAIALLACLLLWYNNNNNHNSNSNYSTRNSIRRTPRPRVNETLLALEEEDTSITCIEDVGGYSMHLFSREPLVVYIENFVSKEERAHLLEIRFVKFLFWLLFFRHFLNLF